MMQVPPEYKNARRFFNHVMHERNWIAGKLNDGYYCIGSRQREFIDSLDCSRLYLYTKHNLGLELGLSYHTVRRLFRGRFVAIEKEGKKYFFPTETFFVWPEDLHFYDFTMKMNEALASEPDSGVAISDGAMEGFGFKRRTATKYRQKTGVPLMHAREREYRAGRKEPFRAMTEIERWIEHSMGLYSTPE